MKKIAAIMAAALATAAAFGQEAKMDIAFDPSRYLALETLSAEEVLCILRGEVDKKAAADSLFASILPGFGVGYGIQNRGRTGPTFLGISEVACFTTVPLSFGLLAGVMGLLSVFSGDDANAQIDALFNGYFVPGMYVSAGVFGLLKAFEIWDITAYPDAQNAKYRSLMDGGTGDGK